MRSPLALMMICASLYAAPALADKAGPYPERASSQLSLEEIEKAKGFSLGKRKLAIREEPRPFRVAKFMLEDGRKVDLHHFDGKVALVNLWGTWCAPCLREMPSLDRLQQALGGADFEVVAINYEPFGDDVAKARDFYEETGLSALAVYSDPEGDLAKEMGAVARPVTAVLGRDGREIARLIGPAEWDSPVAMAFLRHMIEATRE